VHLIRPNQIAAADGDEIMCLTKSRLILILSLWACVSARAQDASPSPAVGSTLLDPSSITLTGHLESSAPTTVELAIRHSQEQIDQRHAYDAKRSPLEPFWNASFWDSPLLILFPRPVRLLKDNENDSFYTPAYMTSSSRQDDPFFTPAYMTLFRRQQDYKMKSFEKEAQKIFEP
jgi:hypothetical protein